MRLIDAGHLYDEVEKLKESPWFNENTNGARIIRREALNIVEDLCICKAPTVCDMKLITEEIERERDSYPRYSDIYDGFDFALDIIRKYTKGESE